MDVSKIKVMWLNVNFSSYDIYLKSKKEDAHKKNIKKPKVRGILSVMEFSFAPINFKKVDRGIDSQEGGSKIWPNFDEIVVILQKGRDQLLYLQLRMAPQAHLPP